jgi:hypothetical protein
MQRLLASGTGAAAAPPPLAVPPALAGLVPAADSFLETRERLDKSASDLEETFRSNLQGAFDMLRSRFLAKQVCSSMSGSAGR